VAAFGHGGVDLGLHLGEAVEDAVVDVVELTVVRRPPFSQQRRDDRHRLLEAETRRS